MTSVCCREYDMKKNYCCGQNRVVAMYVILMYVWQTAPKSQMDCANYNMYDERLRFVSFRLFFFFLFFRKIPRSVAQTKKRMHFESGHVLYYIQSHRHTFVMNAYLGRRCFVFLLRLAVRHENNGSNIILVDNDRVENVQDDPYSSGCGRNDRTMSIIRSSNVVYTLTVRTIWSGFKGSDWHPPDVC